MGNKPSTSNAQQPATKSKKKTKQAQKAKPKRRNGSKTRHSGRERPLSDPGPHPDASVSGDQFHFSSPSHDLTGHHPIGIVTEEDQDEVDRGWPQSQTNSKPSPTNSPASVPRRLEDWENAVGQVISIWPEYKALKGVPAANLPPSTVYTLQQVLIRLADQQNGLHSLERQHAQATQSLEDELQDLATAKRRLEIKVNALQEDVALLRNSLRSAYDKIERQPSMAVRGKPDTNHSDPNTQNSDIPRSPQNADDDSEEQKKPKFNQGIYKATPLLKAEGIEGSKAAVQRTPSMAKPIGYSSPIQRDPSFRIEKESFRTTGDEDLASKMKRLERALERERKEKLALRHNFLPDGGGHSSSLSIDDMTDTYESLESSAIDHIQRSLESHLSHVIRPRRHSFLAAVMQLSFEESQICLRMLREAIHLLLVQPTSRPHQQLQQPTSEYATGPRQARNNIKDINPPKGMSVLAMRTLTGGEVPDAIMGPVLVFLEHISEVTDIADLVERTVDRLCAQFPDCTSASVLNKPAFANFLRDCCRLSWQMNILMPPLQVVSESNARFDDRMHVTHKQPRPEAGTMVGYYIWPVLLSKKHGDVLSRGKVWVQET